MMDTASINSEEFELIESEDAILEPEDIAKIQAWLRPTDYVAESSEYHRHLSSQAPDTGLWICETDQYRQWFESSEHGSLWIKGVPGSGKSVLAASIIDHLKRENKVPVLWFFFRQIIATNRNHRSLSQDWLAQLVPYSSHLQALIHPRLDGELADTSNDQLWAWLLAGLSSFPRVYCIVDAMDEMDASGRTFFLKQLDNLAAFRPESIKVFMTSRPHQYLQSGLKNSSIVHISLEQDLVGKDIRSFVTHRLIGIAQEETTCFLRDIICERAGGLFLYARLILDQVVDTLQSSNEIDIKELANSLPIGLEDMYNSILVNQTLTPAISTEIQLVLLEAVTHASRPLRLNELSSYLASVVPLSTPDNPKGITRRACGPLLEILEDETVQVIHHSFTEFLLDVDRSSRPVDSKQFPIIDTCNADKKLAIRCMFYLQSGVFTFREGTAREKQDPTESEECDDDDDDDTQAVDYQSARLQHPFLEYAVNSWSYHASRYDAEDEELFSVLDRFLNPTNTDFKHWTHLVSGSGASPIHIASFSGLTKYASALLGRGETVDSRDYDNRTPLHWAARNGHAKMARMLLEHNANPNPDDIRGLTPLHEASKKNHASTVRLLLEAGVDPLTPKTRENHSRRLKGGEPSTKGETAVHYALNQGHAQSIMAMIPYLSQDVVAEVLCMACAHGKPEVVRILLENTDVSANATMCGETALYHAAAAHNFDCVALLLARNANVHVKSQWQDTGTGRLTGPRRALNRTRIASTPKTALQGLVSSIAREGEISFGSVLRALLDAGADIDEKDERGRTLLHLLRRSENKFRALLKAGAHTQLNIQDDEGETPVHKIMRETRDLALFQLFFDYGANIESRGKFGDSMLHAALSLSTKSPRDPATTDEVVLFLLAKGARCEAKDNSGRTVLEIAASQCSVETFKILLPNCQDSSARDRCLFHHNYSWSKAEMMEYIEVLRSEGVDLEVRNSAGQTPLLANVGRGEYSGALEKSGARLDSVDKNGKGILHVLCGSIFLMKEIQYFLDQGCNPHILDGRQNSLLHEIAIRYDGSPTHVETVRKLLGLGLLVSAQNVSGKTPYHLYIERAPMGSGSMGSEVFSTSHVPLISLFRATGRDFDLEVQDTEGMTPLHMACLRSEVLVSRLLADGADYTKVNKDGRNVLHLACRARQSNVVGLLLKKVDKALVDKPDASLRTPLHDACTSGRPETVYYLLRAGASVAAKDARGRTPLHACAEFAVEQMAWSTLRVGNPGAKQLCSDIYRPAGHTSPPNQPWHSCAWMLAPEFQDDPDTLSIARIVTMLIANGADNTVTDENHHDPLDLGLWYSCKSMVRSLLESGLYPTSSTEIGSKDSMRLAAARILTRSASLAHLDATSILELMECPLRFIKCLSPDDIEHLDHEGVDMVAPRKSIPSSSILNFLASEGLTDLMARVGHHAKAHENARWMHGVSEDEEAVQYSLDTKTPLQACCERKTSNMIMLELLVDRFGVDVNGQALINSSRGAASPLVPGPTPLHYLAQARYWWQIDAVEYLVGKGADVNALDEKGETPLHIASKFESNRTQDMAFWKLDCVRALLDLGANPNLLDASGDSCLQKASMQPAIMEELLRRGADPFIGSISPLFAAIQAGNVSAVKMLINHGVGVDCIDSTKKCSVHYSVKDQARYALLCAACPSPFNQDIKDFVPVVKFLIERGADVHAKLNKEDTLIHYIFENSEYEIVMAILEVSESVDFNARDSRGRSVFLAACDWIETLPGYKHKHWSAKEKAPALRILEIGADITAVDHDGRHALHHLLDTPECEDDTILHMLNLSDCRPLITSKDNKGYSPLHCALRLLRPVICEALVARGADLLEQDPEGLTALHYIAPQHLKSRISIRRSTGYRDLPPEYKIQCTRLWEQYLRLGGHVNVHDRTGATPLFSYLSTPTDYSYSSEGDGSPHVEHFEKFFANVDMHARNLKGETPLHVVASREDGYYDVQNRKRDRQLFEFLIASGLDPLQEDNHGRSALDVAAACEKKSILELFQYAKK